MSVLPNLKSRLASREAPDPDAELRGSTDEVRQSRLVTDADRSVLLQAAGIWLATRAVFVAFTYFAVLFTAQPTGGRLNLTKFPPDVMMNAWVRWDANWYIQIAAHGYAASNGDLHRLGFFPLYPLITHIVSLVIGSDHIVFAAMLVSNLATLVGFCALGLLALDLYGARTSVFSIRMAAAYPLAFFTFAPYSDSLLFALAGLTLLFARRGRWGWAAGFAFLAGFDRLLAVVLIIPLIWEFVTQNRRPDRPWRESITLPVAARGILVAGAIPLALGLWSAYLGLRFDHASGYLTAQNLYWGHESFGPWRGLQLAYDSVTQAAPWSYPRARVLVDVFPVVALLVLTLATIRRMPASFSLYLGSLLLVLLSSGVPLDYDPLNGEGRYIIIAIPAFLILGKWAQSRPSLDTLLLAGGFMFQGLLTAYFLHGGWIV